MEHRNHDFSLDYILGKAKPSTVCRHALEPQPGPPEAANQPVMLTYPGCLLLREVRTIRLANCGHDGYVNHVGTRLYVLKFNMMKQ